MLYARPGAEPDWIQITCASSNPCSGDDWVFEIKPSLTTAGARRLAGSVARSISARISARSFDSVCLSQAAGLSIGRKGD